MGDGGFTNDRDICSVSVANSSVHPQTASEYAYYTFGELTRLTYCLLQKIKQGSSLPLVEQWEEFVLANHSKFPPINDEEFLSGTRVLAALNKSGSSNLRGQLQRDARRFLEEFTNSVLSTVAAHSKIGQRLSCFCPAINNGGTTTRRCICLFFCWMDFRNGVGLKAVRLRLVGLSTSPLSRSNDSWSGLQR